MKLPIDESTSFNIPGVISAFSIPGKRRTTNLIPGDALLIDLELGILAVADSPEKNPEASRCFLEKFGNAVTGSGILKSGISNLNDNFEKIFDITNSLIKAAKYHDSTTFSAFIIGENGQAAILHTGDSLIYLIRDGGKEIIQLSRTNHLLVGRSPHLFQTETISLSSGDTVLLATDGITDLARCFGLSTEVFLSKKITKPDPVMILNSIAKSVQSVDINLDDIGVIAAIPGSIKYIDTDESQKRIIL